MKRTTQEGLLNVYIFVLKQETKQTDTERKRGKERVIKQNGKRSGEWSKSRKQKSSENSVTVK